eukprot:31158-Pelagococcus_subviridis.AAC.11
MFIQSKPKTSTEFASASCGHFLDSTRTLASHGCCPKSRRDGQSSGSNGRSVVAAHAPGPDVARTSKTDMPSCPATRSCVAEATGNRELFQSSVAPCSRSGSDSESGDRAAFSGAYRGNTAL